MSVNQNSFFLSPPFEDEVAETIIKELRLPDSRIYINAIPHQKTPPYFYLNHLIKILSDKANKSTIKLNYNIPQSEEEILVNFLPELKKKIKFNLNVLNHNIHIDDIILDFLNINFENNLLTFIISNIENLDNKSLKIILSCLKTAPDSIKVLATCQSVKNLNNFCYELTDINYKIIDQKHYNQNPPLPLTKINKNLLTLAKNKQEVQTLTKLYENNFFRLNESITRKEIFEEILINFKKKYSNNYTQEIINILYFLIKNKIFNLTEIANAQPMHLKHNTIHFINELIKFDLIKIKTPVSQEKHISSINLNSLIKNNLFIIIYKTNSIDIFKKLKALLSIKNQCNLLSKLDTHVILYSKKCTLIILKNINLMKNPKDFINTVLTFSSKIISAYDYTHGLFLLENLILSFKKNKDIFTNHQIKNITLQYISLNLTLKKLDNATKAIEEAERVSLLKDNKNITILKIKLYILQKKYNKAIELSKIKPLSSFFIYSPKNIFKLIKFIYFNKMEIIISKQENSFDKITLLHQDALYLTLYKKTKTDTTKTINSPSFIFHHLINKNKSITQAEIQFRLTNIIFSNCLKIVSKGASNYSIIQIFYFALFHALQKRLTKAINVAKYAYSLLSPSTPKEVKAKIFALYYGILYYPIQNEKPHQLKCLSNAIEWTKEQQDAYYLTVSFSSYIMKKILFNHPLSSIAKDVKKFQTTNHGLIIFTESLNKLDLLLSKALNLKERFETSIHQKKHYTNVFFALSIVTETTYFLIAKNYKSIIKKIKINQPMIKQLIAHPVLYFEYIFCISYSYFKSNNSNRGQLYFKKIKHYSQLDDAYCQTKLLILEALHIFNKKGSENKALEKIQEALEIESSLDLPALKALLHETRSELLFALSLKEAATYDIYKAIDLYKESDYLFKTTLLIETLNKNSKNTYESSSIHSLDSSFKSLLNISQVFSSTKTIPELIKQLFIFIQDIAKTDKLYIFLKNEKSFTEYNLHTKKQHSTYFKTKNNKYFTSIINQTLETKLTTLIDTNSKIFKTEIDHSLIKEKPKQLICQPLKSDSGNLFGVIYIEIAASKQILNSFQLNLLESISFFASLSLENIYLFLENKKLIKTLEDRVSTQVSKLRQADIDMQKSQEIARKAAEQSSYATLTRGIAHEIRNPMAMILSGAELISDNINDQEKVVKYTKTVKDSIIRLNNITNTMLQYGNPVSKFKEYLDIKKIISDTLTICSAESKKRNIKLIAEHNTTPLIYGDKNSIQQVILNLLLNSFEAMKDGGIIKIKTATESFHTKRNIVTEGLKLTIEDTGKGIPKNKIDKIFDPFFSTKYGNSGLGLSIVLKTISEHQGTVKINSIEDQGTSFHIYFPKATKPELTTKKLQPI